MEKTSLIVKNHVENATFQQANNLKNNLKLIKANSFDLINTKINIHEFSEKLTAKPLLKFNESKNSSADKIVKLKRNKSERIQDHPNISEAYNLYNIFTSKSNSLFTVNNSLTTTGFMIQSESEKKTQPTQSSVTKSSSSLKRTTNIPRTITFSYGSSNYFNPIIDGKGLNEPKSAKILSENSKQSNLTNESNIKNLNQTKYNYSISNTHNQTRSILYELNETGKKLMPINENSIQKIRKLLKLENIKDQSINETISKPKYPINGPKLKTPPLHDSSVNAKTINSEFLMKIKHLKLAEKVRSTSKESPITISSLSNQDDANKYTEYVFLEEDENEDDQKPIKIFLADKAPPTTPLNDFNDCGNCLFCQKEAKLRNKFKSSIQRNNKYNKNSRYYDNKDQFILKPSLTQSIPILATKQFI